MFDTGFYNQGRGLESGLRAGAAIGGTIKGMMSTNAVQQAAARIQAGEDQATVIQQLMAQDPAAAQQLINLSRGNTQLSSEVQEIEQLKKKYGMENLQSSALPLFGAFVTDDEKSQDKLIEEAAAPFKGQSDGVHETILDIKKLKGESRINALGGMVKALRQAGVYPDDPSQMMGMGQSADIAKFEYWKQMNPNATEAQQQEVYNKIIDPFYRSQAAAQGAANVRLETEKGLNPILADREATKTTAIEGTPTGQAKLTQEQQAVAKGQAAVDADKEQKTKALEASKEALRLTESIMNNKNLGSVTGVNALTPTFNPESQDLINQASQLLALLTAENLKLMSGVLSETDIKMLRDLSSGLNVSEKGIKGSEQAIRARLNDIASKLRTTLQSKGVLDDAGSDVVEWSSLNGR